MKTVKRIFVSGFIILLPTIISIYVLSLTFRAVDSFLSVFMQRTLGIDIPGLGFIAMVAAIFIVGLIAANVLGKKFLELMETAFIRLPFIKTIYVATKQIVEAFSGDRGKVFESVVMIEYPRQGIYVLAFVTGPGTGEAQAKTNKNVVPVFLPSTPNPTTGFLLFVPKEELIYMDMTIEEAMKMIISGGVLVPKPVGTDERSNGCQVFNGK